MELPYSFIQSMAGLAGFDREAFLRVHASPEQVTSIRLNPSKPPGEIPGPGLPENFPHIHSGIPWCETGYYLEKRPSFTFDPHFHAGCYYVQEASSMFLEQALCQSTDLSGSLKILDLCAAPGGKSTHVLSLITADSLLVSNEVIRSRVHTLKENIIKWGAENSVITNNDPKDFARLENYFDVLMVDAPCSGSGLFRRDPEAIDEWSEHQVQLCSQRQRRILADALPSLKKGGTLIYSTCSYSVEEDEEIVTWLERECSLVNIPLSVRHAWKIVGSGGGYRFWPDQVKGEGFFIACFRKESGDENAVFTPAKKTGQVSKQELAVLKNWVKQSGRTFIRNGQTIYAWADGYERDAAYLLEHLRVVYSGVKAGELVRDKLVPDHALAMSHIMDERISRTELSYGQAIAYLQRKELDIGNPERGWQLVCFRGNPLGWINVLGNRINNYYPKELRILKDKPG